jgi:hypothetical protein
MMPDLRLRLQTQVLLINNYEAHGKHVIQDGIKHTHMFRFELHTHTIRSETCIQRWG